MLDRVDAVERKLTFSVIEPEAARKAKIEEVEMKRWLVRILILAAILYAGATAWVYYIMHLPPSRFAKNFARLPMTALVALPFESMWMRARAGELRPGDAAPDFELPVLDRSQQVRLSGLRGKPVLLVFGSYT